MKGILECKILHTQKYFVTLQTSYQRNCAKNASYVRVEIFFITKFNLIIQQKKFYKSLKFNLFKNFTMFSLLNHSF